MTDDPLYQPVSNRIFETLSDDLVRWLKDHGIVTLAQIVEAADRESGPSPDANRELKDLAVNVRRFLRIPASTAEEEDAWWDEHPSGLPRADRDREEPDDAADADRFLRGDPNDAPGADR